VPALPRSSPSPSLSRAIGRGGTTAASSSRTTSAAASRRGRPGRRRAARPGHQLKPGDVVGRCGWTSGRARGPGHSARTSWPRRSAGQPGGQARIGPPVKDGSTTTSTSRPFTRTTSGAREGHAAHRQREPDLCRRSSRDEARAELADEPYKLELIGIKAGPAVTRCRLCREGAEAEVAAASSPSTTTYGGRVGRWRDCAGPASADHS